MERKQVKSSNILSVGYDPEKKILEIEFSTGRVYQYSNVPQWEYDTFIKAESIGKYFYRSIKGHYEFKKIT